MIVREIKVLFFLTVLSNSLALKILAVYLTPSISHQIAFRPLTQALARRGNEIVVITVDPAFPEGHTPENLTEIDIHDLSYKIWKDGWNETTNKNSIYEHTASVYKLVNKLFLAQMKEEKVRNVIEEHFDLLLIEPAMYPAIGLSHKLKAPMILISSFGRINDHYEIIGSSSHPIFHPLMIRERVYKLNIWEKIKAVYDEFYLYSSLKTEENKSNNILRNVIDESIPPLNVLKNDVSVFFVNMQPVLDDCPAVPLGMVYMTDLDKYPSTKIPEDLRDFMDGSKNGVIHISFGTNVIPSMLAPGIEKLFIETFSKLPYDILMKWHTEDIPGKTANVKIANWFPQIDVLRHPKLKLFITHAGLQSTLEAIATEVPLIGLPVILDQWHNAEKYVHTGIGLKMDQKQLTVDALREAINEVIGNQRYRENIARLRVLMTDHPQPPLERAVWWTEYVLRHGGARHLRSPAANISWTQYYEIELLAYLLVGLVGVLVVIVLLLNILIKFVIKCFSDSSKTKLN